LSSISTVNRTVKALSM